MRWTSSGDRFGRTQSLLDWVEAGGKEEVRDEFTSLAPTTSLLTCQFVQGDRQEGGSAVCGVGKVSVSGGRAGWSC